MYSNLKRDLSAKLAFSLWALCLVLGSVSSKAMGLAWLVFVVIGIGLWIKSVARRRSPLLANTSSAEKKLELGQVWLIITGIALLIRLLAAGYWHEGWQDRHAEFRLFLAAWASYGFLQHEFSEQTGLLVQRTYLTLHGLALGSWGGLALLLAYGTEQLPTYPIPWAVVMALISALLLAHATMASAGRTSLRLFWFTGALGALFAALGSGKRGAFVIVLIWLAYGIAAACWYWQSSEGRPRPVRLKGKAVVAILLVVLVSAGLNNTVLQKPIQSVESGIAEFSTALSDSSQATVNTSVGARIYLWRRSAEALTTCSWLGCGAVARRAMIHAWGEETQSPMILSLSHVHNQFLNDLLDHGLPGLLSTLLYVGGLAWLARKSRQQGHAVCAWTLGGFAIIHVISGLSNVNFLHNYYTSALSLLIALTLIAAGSRLESDRAAGPARSP